MSAGKNLKQAQQAQFDIAKQQQQLGTLLSETAKQDINKRAQMQELPLRFYQQAGSGSPAALNAATARQTAEMARQAQASKSAIAEMMGPGAARDFAMAQITRDLGGQKANFLNQAFLDSLGALQGMANEQGQFALQELGAGMRGSEGAAQTNQQVAQTEAQRQAAKWSALGGLASMAGGALTGGLGAGLGKGLGKGLSSGFGKLFGAGGLFNKYAIGGAMHSLPLVSGMAGIQVPQSFSSGYNQLNQGEIGGGLQ